MSKKGVMYPHTDLILDLYAEGYACWQICLWSRPWTLLYVKRVIQGQRRKKPLDPRLSINRRVPRQYSWENFMDHQPRYFLGQGHICLRCKRKCDEESEFDGFECTATKEEFGRKRGRGSPNYDPMKRLKHGRKYYKNG